MLRTYDYNILLVRVGHEEGSHVFTFLISAMGSSVIWLKTLVTSIHRERDTLKIVRRCNLVELMDWRNSLGFSLVCEIFKKILLSVLVRHFAM